MENLNQIVKSIVRLWNVHRYRETLYKQAMSMDDLGPLRRTFSQGYISSLLFKKEIHGLYDEVKCNLNDGEIHHSEIENDLPLHIVFPDDLDIITNQIREHERTVHMLYNRLLSQQNISDYASSIFDEHLEKLNHMRENFERNVTRFQESQHAMA